MSTLAAPVAVRVGRRWYERSKRTGGDLYAPFELALYGRRMRMLRLRPLATAPVGIYKLPQEEGERVVSTWPADFTGPLKAARSWALLTPDGRRVAGRADDFPPLFVLGQPDTMSVTVTLTGAR